MHFKLQGHHKNSFHSFLVFSFSSFLPFCFPLVLYYSNTDSKGCMSKYGEKCVVSQYTQCSQTSHHLPWLGFSVLASSPCDLPYPVIVHCLKRKSSYITLNISDSVPFFLLTEAHSDSTAVKKLECKEHNARLNVCSCYSIVTERFAAVHTKGTSVISYAVILTAWTNILVLTTTRLLLEHMYIRKVSKWKLGCTRAAKGFHAN